ncbi:hypothetical protein Tco_0797450 [Tanacetum coccineum]
MKAVLSSSHVSIVPSLSSSSHVFASPVSDRGNIIRRTASFQYLVILNNIADPRIVIRRKNQELGATTLVGSPHGSIIHWIVNFKNIRK